MNISENAKSCATAVCSALGVDPDDKALRRVTQLIERSIINAVLNEAERYTHVVMNCCSADLNLAHKVADEIRASNDALIANLASMR
ncbi:MAG: hypothetical protein R3174_01365 [Gammaproteobacteria bacterium]|nr:hypothetical protein [Gammaproteobacteria bacterium]